MMICMHHHDIPSEREYGRKKRKEIYLDKLLSCRLLIEKMVLGIFFLR